MSKTIITSTRFGNTSIFSSLKRMCDLNPSKFNYDKLRNKKLPCLHNGFTIERKSLNQEINGINSIESFMKEVKIEGSINREEDNTSTIFISNGSEEYIVELKIRIDNDPINENYPEEAEIEIENIFNSEGDKINLQDEEHKLINQLIKKIMLNKYEDNQKLNVKALNESEEILQQIKAETDEKFKSFIEDRIQNEGYTQEEAELYVREMNSYKQDFTERLVCKFNEKLKLSIYQEDAIENLKNQIK